MSLIVLLCYWYGNDEIMRLAMLIVIDSEDGEEEDETLAEFMSFHLTMRWTRSRQSRYFDVEDAGVNTSLLSSYVLLNDG